MLAVAPQAVRRTFSLCRVSLTWRLAPSTLEGQLPLIHPGVLVAASELRTQSLAVMFSSRNCAISLTALTGRYLYSEQARNHAEAWGISWHRKGCHDVYDESFRVENKRGFLVEKFWNPLSLFLFREDNSLNDIDVCGRRRKTRIGQFFCPLHCTKLTTKIHDENVEKTKPTA